MRAGADEPGRNFVDVTYNDKDFVIPNGWLTNLPTKGQLSIHYCRWTLLASLLPTATAPNCTVQFVDSACASISHRNLNDFALASATSLQAVTMQVTVLCLGCGSGRRRLRGKCANGTKAHLHGPKDSRSDQARC